MLCFQAVMNKTLKADHIKSIIFREIIFIAKSDEYLVLICTHSNSYEDQVPVLLNLSVTHQEFTISSHSGCLYRKKEGNKDCNTVGTCTERGSYL